MATRTDKMTVIRPGPAEVGDGQPKQPGRTRKVSQRLDRQKASNEQSGLLTAASLGHLSVVESLIRYGTKLDAPDEEGKTSLIWAARNGHSAVVNLLLQHGANLHAADQRGRTAIFWAATNGHWDTVKLLLLRGAQVHLKDKEGYTALESATMNHHEKVVDLLKSAGAISSHQVTWQDTPQARFSRKASTGQLLVVPVRPETEPVVHLAPSPATAKSYSKSATEIQVTVSQGRKETNGMVSVTSNRTLSLSQKIEDLLLRFDYSKVYLMGVVLPLLTEGRVSIEVGDNVERIEIAKADVLNAAQASQLVDDHLKTLSLRQSSPGQVIKPLLTIGSGIMPSLKSTEPTAPVSRVIEAPAKATRAVEPAGRPSGQPGSSADPNPEQRPMQEPALFQAATEGLSATIRTMVQEGANINAPLPDDWTALGVAAWNGHAKTVETLIQLGAHFEDRTQNRWTPLMIAVSRGHDQITKALLDSGANANAKDPDGKTPLMWAAQRGSAHMVEMLLAKGANLNARNAQGLTARGYAQREGHKEIIKLLDKLGIRELIQKGAMVR